MLSKCDALRTQAPAPAASWKALHQAPALRKKKELLEWKWKNNPRLNKHSLVIIRGPLLLQRNCSWARAKTTSTNSLVKVECPYKLIPTCLAFLCVVLLLRSVFHYYFPEIKQVSRNLFVVPFNLWGQLMFESYMTRKLYMTRKQKQMIRSC